MSTQASLAVDTFARLLRAHAASTRVLSADLVAEHGLTINDYEALLYLSRAEDRRLKRVDLAGRLLLTASGVTRLLEGLERAGYVARATCDSDARVTYAVLTDEGHAKLAAASRAHLAAIDELFEAALSREEIETLGELLGRLPGAAGVDGADCSPG